MFIRIFQLCKFLLEKVWSVCVYFLITLFYLRMLLPAAILEPSLYHLIAFLLRLTCIRIFVIHRHFCPLCLYTPSGSLWSCLPVNLKNVTISKILILPIKMAYSTFENILKEHSETHHRKKLYTRFLISLIFSIFSRRYYELLITANSLNIGKIYISLYKPTYAIVKYIHICNATFIFINII